MGEKEKKLGDLFLLIPKNLNRFVGSTPIALSLHRYSTCRPKRRPGVVW